jgi:hypothetical protein
MKSPMKRSLNLILPNVAWWLLEGLGYFLAVAIIAGLAVYLRLAAS